MPSKEVLAKKQAYVSKLVDSVQNAQSVVFSDYQGLNVEQDTEMRQNFREENAHYMVVKNTLGKRAFAQLGIDEDALTEIFKGPTAVSWSDEDITLAPRLLKQHITKYKKMAMKAGIVKGELISLDTLKQIADIPSLDVLHGQLVASLIFPIKAFAMVLDQIADKAADAGVDSVADLMAQQAATPAEEAAEDAE